MKTILGLVFVAAMSQHGPCSSPSGPTIRHAWEVCQEARVEGDYGHASCLAFTTRTLSLGAFPVCKYDPAGALQPDATGRLRTDICLPEGEPSGCFTFENNCV